MELLNDLLEIIFRTNISNELEICELRYKREDWQSKFKLLFHVNKNVYVGMGQA